MNKKIKKFINDNKYILLLVLFCLIYMSPIYSTYIHGDDTVFHLHNIDLYSEVSIFSKIVPLFANNLGWGVGIFYPCLPHIICALILRITKLIGFSAIGAIKIVKILITILSATSMYLLSNKLYKDKSKGLICSLLYIASSYYFVDVYMRDALNETAVFIFIPLIFLGLLYLFEDNNKKNFYICFITVYIGLIYTHLVLTMWFSMFLIFFLLVYIKDIFKKKNFFPLLYSTIIVIIFTSTFTFPLIEHMYRGLWFIPTYKNVWVYPLEGHVIESYFSTGTNAFGKNLLFIHFSPILILLIIISIINLLFKKKYKYNKRFIIGIIIFSTLSIFFTSFTPFWENAPKIFKNIANF